MAAIGFATLFGTPIATAGAVEVQPPLPVTAPMEMQAPPLVVARAATGEGALAAPGDGRNTIAASTAAARVGTRRKADAGTVAPLSTKRRKTTAATAAAPVIKRRGATSGAVVAPANTHMDAAANPVAPAVGEYTDAEWDAWFATEIEDGIPAPKTPTTPRESLDAGTRRSRSRSRSPRRGNTTPADTTTVEATAAITNTCEVMSRTANTMQELYVPKCSKCKTPVDPLRCSGKSEATFKCSGCNSKCVMLHKRYGKWPIGNFKLLSDDDQAEFYKSTHTKSIDDIEKMLTEKLSKTDTEYKGTENKGEWLPMSVWVSRGWNEAEILSTATSKNTKPHPRWGTVYQVCVEADIDGNLEKQTKTKEFIADQREQAKDGRRAKVAVAVQVEPVVDENALRKAREQAEKDERALEKKAQQDIAKRARDEEKIKRATLALAAKTYAKLSGVRDSLGEELKGNVSLLPEWAVTQAKATKASADSKLAESQKVVAKKLNLLSFGVDDVQDTYMATVEATRLLAGLKKCCKKK
jgi:hypothetical protein